jgi:hypothetical protein
MIKFSDSYRAKIARIKRLPKISEDIMMSKLKRDTTNLIEEFQKGVRLNNFGLRKLQKVTVDGKFKLKYDKPDTPLYGLGDREDKSYINMFRIRKIKNGYKIYPSWAKHHKSKLSLRSLFLVHEYGCTISMPNGAVVRIPPRPALFKAYEILMNKKRRDKRETSKEVKTAMTEYINTGKKLLIDKIEKRDLMGHKDYEKND